MRGEEHIYQKLLLQYFRENKIHALPEYQIGGQDRIDIYLPHASFTPSDKSHSHTIIEIKKATQFKQAMGQILTYAQYFTLARKSPPEMLICLFGAIAPDKSIKIQEIYKEKGIHLWFVATRFFLQDVTGGKMLAELELK
jgi:hypothetical protein